MICKDQAAGNPMNRLPLPAIVLLGILLLVPTAGMGFYADDYVHQLVLRGDQEQAPMEPWSLYDFGTREDWHAMDGEVGTFPWWTDDDWKIRFLRPVSSLYLMAQYAVWGEWAPGYHLAGLTLFGLLLVLTQRLYRALGFSDRAARIGTLLFAVCDSAVLPVGWTANNNSLLVAVFSVAAFRYLLDGRYLLGLFLAVGAAGSNEAGAVTLALAALVLLRGSARRSRAVGILAVGLCVAYAALLLGGGYGTRSVFYATPWSEPGRFAEHLLVLVTGGSASLLGPFPLDVVSLFPETRLPVVLFGCLVGLPIWFGIARSVKGKSGVGWLAVWSLAFLIPQAGTIAADRLLFIPAIGALGILALFFEERASRPTLPTRLLWWSATVGSALYLLVQGIGLSAGAAFLRESAPRTDVGSPDLGHRDIFVLQTESQFQAFTLHSMWGFHSADRELTFWNLQHGRRALRWTRIDERTFELEALDEPFFAGAFETVYMTRTPAFEVGDTWSTLKFDVEALEVLAGRPVLLRFRIDASLDDETVRFVRPEDGRLVRILPPPVGESVTLEAPERVGPYMP
jgi:hypothetical protein